MTVKHVKRVWMKFQLKHVLAHKCFRHWIASMLILCFLFFTKINYLIIYFSFYPDINKGNMEWSRLSVKQSAPKKKRTKAKKTTSLITIKQRSDLVCFLLTSMMQSGKEMESVCSICTRKPFYFTNVMGILSIPIQPSFSLQRYRLSCLQTKLRA